MLDFTQEFYESIAKELPDFMQSDFSRVLLSKVNWAKEFAEANLPDWLVEKFGVEGGKIILKKGFDLFKSRFPYFQNDPTNFENMQEMFTKALSGDLEKPGAYSLRGLNKISEMNAEVAQLFTKLCSISMLCIENRMDYEDLNCIQPKEVTSDRIIDIRVFDFNTHTGNALSNMYPYQSLARYGFSYNEISKLSDYGLVRIEHGNYPAYEGEITLYNQRLWTFRRSDNRLEKWNFFGLPFTDIGRELFSLVNLQENVAYTNNLREFMQSKNINMIPLYYERSSMTAT